MKKPESKDPIHIPRPKIRDMSEDEAEATRRARFLMSWPNIQEAQKNRGRLRFIYFLLLAIAMVTLIVWALTR